MGLRIGTNVASIAAQRQLSRSAEDLGRSLKQVASGDRFSDMTQGSADFAIAETLRAQIKGHQAAKFNAENATSFVQVAEGGLNEQANIMIRLRELAVQAASDTVGDSEREMLEMEFSQLLRESDRIAESTRFGNAKLLNGTDQSYQFQVGVHQGEENIIRYESNTNTTNSALGVDGLSVLDQNDAREVLGAVDEAMTNLGKARAQFGAVNSRLQSVVNNSGVQIENLSAARSRMADTDVAAAMSEVYKHQALQQYQTQVLSIANQAPGQALRLLA